MHSNRYDISGYDTPKLQLCTPEYQRTSQSNCAKRDCIVLIRYRCSHRCNQPFLPPQEESQATKTKLSSKKARKDSKYGRMGQYLKSISLAVLHDNITSTYPVYRTHTDIIACLSESTFILAKRTGTVFRGSYAR